MLLFLALAIVACGGTDEVSDETPGTGTGQFPAEIAAQAVGNYSEIVHANYTDSLNDAKTLNDALKALVADPTDATLLAAQTAWINSRESYLQTEVFRFYDGPIDNPTDGPEGLLNAWPMDEKYIDYVADDPTSGKINDLTFEISAENLVNANEQGGEENIATGYHAIEFLLWGQDLDDPSAKTTGQRPVADYVVDGGTANADRRGLYLTTVGDLLISDLQTMVDAWAPGAQNYRAEFEGADAKEGLRRILTGMIVLSGFETGGERLQTALDSGDQEDEHSCFSDNTHRDMVQDAVGIQNIWKGTYSSVSGTGIEDIVTATDADLAGRLTTQIDQSVALGNALQAPFDNEIGIDNAEGRQRVQALITSLRAQESLLEEVFLAYDLSIPEPE
jgi:putative iron-regulated protein